MGSLVMSQAQPAINHHPYHHMMVDTNHPQDEASTRPRSASVSTATRHPSSSTTEAQTPTNRDHDTDDPHPPAAEHSQHDHPSTSHSSTSRQQPSYYPHNVNQHSRGFDQSGFPLSNDPRLVVATSPPGSPRLQPTYRSTRSLGGSEATSPSRIKVRDLSHIRSFASEEYLARPRLASRHPSGFSDTGRQYEISSMPVTDIIEMVAGLLTKITTTNDRQHEHHRPVALTEEQSNLSPQANCVLAFHGKNVPGITILSYLSRIHKYCPTTYEVFLSLLVYFDRMTEAVNRRLYGNASGHPNDSPATAPESSSPNARSPLPMNVDSPQQHTDVSTPPASASHASPEHRAITREPSFIPSANPQDLSQFFVVDSYNIHRLVIAGVTCASKFFSDVFYTNSRYAKVSNLSSVLGEDVNKLTPFRSAVFLLWNSTTSNFSSLFLMTLDFRYQWKNSRRMALCWWSFTLENWLHNSKQPMPQLHQARQMACT